MFTWILRNEIHAANELEKLVSTDFFVWHELVHDKNHINILIENQDVNNRKKMWLNIETC